MWVGAGRAVDLPAAGSREAIRRVDDLVELGQQRGTIGLGMAARVALELDVIRPQVGDRRRAGGRIAFCDRADSGQRQIEIGGEAGKLGDRLAVAVITSI